jgi:hypothetical protein
MNTNLNSNYDNFATNFDNANTTTDPMNSDFTTSGEYVPKLRYKENGSVKGLSYATKARGDDGDSLTSSRRRSTELLRETNTGKTDKNDSSIESEEISGKWQSALFYWFSGVEKNKKAKKQPKTATSDRQENLQESIQENVEDSIPEEMVGASDDTMTSALEMQKQKARALWNITLSRVAKLKNNNNFSDHIKAVIDDVAGGLLNVSASIDAQLHIGKVLPIFHANCALVWHSSPDRYMPEGRVAGLFELFKTGNTSIWSGYMVEPGELDTSATATCTSELKCHINFDYVKHGPTSISDPYMAEFFRNQNTNVKTMNDNSVADDSTKSDHNMSMSDNPSKSDLLKTQ